MTVTVLERIPVCLPAPMPHGYTNNTTRDGPTVVKHYPGPDPALRRGHRGPPRQARRGRPASGRPASGRPASWQARQWQARLAITASWTE